MLEIKTGFALCLRKCLSRSTQSVCEHLFKTGPTGADGSTRKELITLSAQQPHVPVDQAYDPPNTAMRCFAVLPKVNLYRLPNRWKADESSPLHFVTSKNEGHCTNVATSLLVVDKKQKFETRTPQLCLANVFTCDVCDEIFRLSF